jgi:hypothetical protein
MEKRRIALLVPVVMLPLIALEELQSVYYVVPVSILSSYAALINFEWLSKIFHQKPIYFEDLYDDVPDALVRDKFQHFFLNSINICLCLTVGIIVYYTMYRFHETPLSLVELLGFGGGMVSVYSTVQSYVGNIILAVMVYLKRRDFRESALRMSAANLNEIR